MSVYAETFFKIQVISFYIGLGLLALLILGGVALAVWCSIPSKREQRGKEE